MFRHGCGLTPHERAELGRRVHALAPWTHAASARAIAEATVPLISTMYQADAGELEAVRAEAYRSALAGIPAPALFAARDAILRGEAPGLSVHFAPTPAELGQEARRHLRRAAGEIEHIVQLLEAGEDGPPPSEAEQAAERERRRADVVALTPHTRTAAKIRRAEAPR